MDSTSQYPQAPYQYTYPNPPYQPHLASSTPPSWPHYPPQQSPHSTSEYPRMYSGVHNPPANMYSPVYASPYAHPPQPPHNAFAQYAPPPLETNPPSSAPAAQIPSSMGPDRGPGRRLSRQASQAPYPRADREAGPTQNTPSDSADVGLLFGVLSDSV